jgi:DNA-binding PucR family transcriptional regulator
VALHIYENIPELTTGGDEQAYPEMRRSTGSNIAALFSLIAADRLAEPEDAPPQALEYARSLVRRGVSLASLLRAYRLGHAVAWNRWSRRLAELVDGEELVEALDATSHAMFRYIDVLADRLVQEYDAERARWVRSASATRLEIARAILDGRPVDVDGASAALGYQLRRHHTAMVLWLGDATAPDTYGGLEGIAAELASAGGFSAPLLLPVAASVLWGWVGSAEQPNEEALELMRACRLPAGTFAALGEPAAGVEGFKRTHEEALQAHRVASLHPRRRQVTRYRSVEIPSLLTVDVQRAQRFARRELAALATADDTAGRLRATLQVFFEEGANRARTARRLNVHENTIAYRISQAEELLGHAISERPFQLQTALALVAELGTDALASAGG